MGKMTLETKASGINVVINPPKDWKGDCMPVEYFNALDLWLGDNAVAYAYIEHNMDIREDGEKKTCHIHLWAKLNACQRLLTSLYKIAKALGCNTEQITIEKASSMEGSIQYFTHQNQPEKTPYDPSLIRCSFEREELKAILEFEAGVFSLERIASIIGSANSILQVIRAVGTPIYEKHRNLIRDIWRDVHGQRF